MSWVSSWYTCLLIWMAEAALALSRTPLIVFQHEVINFASEDIVHEILSQTTTLPDNHYHHYKTSKHLRTLYQIGGFHCHVTSGEANVIQLTPEGYNNSTHAIPTPDHYLLNRVDSEKDLPECEARAVCSKVDLYDSPWIERQCRCPKQQKCPSSLSPNDGHTIADRTRQFKLCEPVKKLPKCRYFRDITWSLRTGADNITSQVVRCHCPKGSVAYLIKRQPIEGPQGIGYLYSFACSPQSRLRCQRKEPCRLFTVRKRMELLDEVNTNTICQCPHNHHCPKHHTHPGVLQGKSYAEENIRTYSGYCIG